MRIPPAVPWAIAVATTLALVITLATQGGDDPVGEPQAADGVGGALFVLTATSGTMEADGDAYTLTLSGVPAATTYFTERPERRAGTVPTSEIGGSVEDAADDPPNAAIVADQAGSPAVFAFELLSLDHDPATGTLTARIQALPGETPPVGALGAVELFIDAIPTVVNGQVTDVTIGFGNTGDTDIGDDLIGNGGDGGDGGTGGSAD